MQITFTIICFNIVMIKFYKTALYLAVEIGNAEIVKLLLTKDKLDINIINISN